MEQRLLLEAHPNPTSDKTVRRGFGGMEGAGREVEGGRWYFKEVYSSLFFEWHKC